MTLFYQCFKMTRGSARQLLDRSRSSAPNQPQVSLPKQILPNPVVKPTFPGQPHARDVHQSDVHPQAFAEPMPHLILSGASIPPVAGNHRPPVTVSALLGGKPVSTIGAALLFSHIVRSSSSTTTAMSIMRPGDPSSTTTTTTPQPTSSCTILPRILCRLLRKVPDQPPTK